MSGNSFLSTMGGTTPVTVIVETIEVQGVGGVSTITANHGTLQMVTLVLPVNAANRTVNWSVTNGTGSASIGNTGILMALANGTVTVRATANDGSTVYDEMIVTISNQVIPPISTSNIIADHNAVADFDNIPANWIDSVKTMMVSFPGESHSVAYDSGLIKLAAANSTYAAQMGEGQSPTNQYLRIDDAYSWIGEYSWYIQGTGWLKGIINLYKTAGHPFSALGFGWCSDMTEGDGTATASPVYGVHWYGNSAGGPDGNKAWGIDADDYDITGNSISLKTYLDLMVEINTWCEANGHKTKVVYTTGPVDDVEWSGEVAIRGILNMKQ